MTEPQQVRLAPLGGIQSRRVSDHTLGELAMRSGFNVEQVDGEWWTRKGEDLILPRLASTQWTWIAMGNVKWIIANAYWALQLNSTNPTAGVTELYSPTATDDVTLERLSQAATCAVHTPAVGELVLVGVGYTPEVYRILAVSGTSFTLDRPYEGESGTVSCRFLPMLARDAAGSNSAYSNAKLGMSAVVFEQLIGHSATDMHGSSPALTAGRRYLIVASAYGCPVAIDLGVVTTVRRNFFYRTGLASGTETNICSANGFGSWVATYKNRLIIANAPDNANRLASRTIWYSSQGDIAQWHVGIKGKTASPTYITFDGPNDDITGLATLRDQVIVHRERSQEIGSFTGSNLAPLNFRANNQNLGLYTGRYSGTPADSSTGLLVHTRATHFIWTQRGPAVFDGAQVSLIAGDAYRSLIGYGAAEPPDVRCVIHDEARALLYWVLGESSPGLPNRHPDASEPASTTRILPDVGAGVTGYVSARTVFVYSYEDGRAWFEDRSALYGGGYLGEPANELYRGVYASRYDGTIVKLRGAATGIDPGISGESEDHVVQAQVETPWIDFGNTVTQKQLTGVELVLRALAVGGVDLADEVSDVWDDPTTDRLFLRLRVYADNDLTTPIDDVGKHIPVADMLALKLTDNRQYPTFSVPFSTNGRGRSLKFRVSNTLTDEAIARGSKMAPFRLAEIVAHYLPKESTDPVSEIRG